MKILRMIGEDAYDLKDIANEIRNDQEIVDLIPVNISESSP